MPVLVRHLLLLVVSVGAVVALYMFDALLPGQRGAMSFGIDWPGIVPTKARGPRQRAGERAPSQTQRPSVPQGYPVVPPDQEPGPDQPRR
jgi:hypothetical protein